MAYIRDCLLLITYGGLAVVKAFLINLFWNVSTGLAYWKLNNHLVLLQRLS